MVLGAAAVLGDDLQLALELRRQLVGVGELVLGEQAGLDALGELDLLLGVEQRDLTDLLQVVLDGVGGGTGRGDLLRGRVVLVLVGQDEALRALLAGLAFGLGRTGGLLGGLVVDLVVLLAGRLLRRRLLGDGLLRGGLLGRRLLGCDLLGFGVLSLGLDGRGLGVAVAATFFAVTVLAATVLVAVRLTGLLAATLLRGRFGSAALTISVTPSSSRI